MVADLLTGFVAEDWVHAVDLGTLDKCSGSYVSDDLRDRQDDVVWRVRRGDEVAYVCTCCPNSRAAPTPGWRCG